MNPPYFTINEHGVPCLDGVPLPGVMHYDLTVPGVGDGFPKLTVTMHVSTKAPKSTARSALLASLVRKPITNFYEALCGETVSREEHFKGVLLDPEAAARNWLRFAVNDEQVDVNGFDGPGQEVFQDVVAIAAIGTQLVRQRYSGVSEPVIKRLFALMAEKPAAP